MNFDRKHKFHRRIKSHSMRVIIMIDVVTCVYIKTQPETYIYIYILYISPKPTSFPIILLVLLLHGNQLWTVALLDLDRWHRP